MRSGGPGKKSRDRLAATMAAVEFSQLKLVKLDQATIQKDLNALFECRYALEWVDGLGSMGSELC